MSVDISEVQTAWLSPKEFYIDLLKPNFNSFVVAYHPDTDRAVWHPIWINNKRYQHRDLMRDNFRGMDPDDEINVSRGYWIPNEGVLALYPEHRGLVEHPRPISYYQRIADQMGIGEEVDLIAALGGGIPWGRSEGPKKGGWVENPYTPETITPIKPTDFYKSIGYLGPTPDQFVVILDTLRDKVISHPRQYLESDELVEEGVRGEGEVFMHHDLWRSYIYGDDWMESKEEQMGLRRKALEERVKGYWIPEEGVLALYELDNGRRPLITVYDRVAEGLGLGEEDVDVFLALE